MSKILSILTNHFPTWVLVCSILALIHPPFFTWFNGEAIVIGLAVIMLGMGMTLRFDDFQSHLIGLIS